MNNLNQNPLFDKVAAGYVFGTIMHEPHLLSLSDKYLLNEDDFIGKLNKIIFGAIYNLSHKGAGKITPLDVDVYLASYDVQHQTFVNDGGKDYLDNVYALTEEFSMATFEFQYERVKKFSTLRELRSKGIDVSEFYNPSFINQVEEENRFNALTIEQILSKVRDKVQLVENHNLAIRTEGKYAFEGVKDLLNSFKAIPELGFRLEGDIFNYATRGARLGKLYMYSAPSGGGKTRTMVGNACSIAFPRIENGYVCEPEELQPVLFVATEMQPDEIQTLILAWISGVNEEKILLNTCTDDELMLIDKAVYIMEKYKTNFIIENISDPTVQSVKSVITNHIITNNIQYIFYDYIFTSPGLMAEFKASNLREDVVLMMLSNTLKEIAAEKNVFIMTASQLNGDWAKTTIRNANTLRGAKSLADKIDCGMIGVRGVKEEVEHVIPYCESKGYPVPNMVIDIYKNRRGKLCDVKIFRLFDYGTCRTKDIVVTTNSTYEVIDDRFIFGYQIKRTEVQKYV